MRKISNKVLSLLVVFCLVLTSISFSAFAKAGDIITTNLYSTTFDTADFVAGTYALTAAGETQIGTSPFYLTNANTPLGDRLSVAIDDVSDKELRFATMEKNSAYQNRQGYVKFKDSTVYNRLGTKYKITYSGSKTDGNFGDPGVRFAMKDQSNFYALIISPAAQGGYVGRNGNTGTATTMGAWALYKVVDNAYTRLTGSDTTTAVASGKEFNCTITVMDKVITCNVKVPSLSLDETKSYTETEWLQPDTSKTSIGFDAAIAYGSGSRAKFTSFSVDSLAVEMASKIEKEDATLYETDFDSDDFVTGTYDLTATGEKQIGTSPWYLTNNQSPLGGHLTMDVVDNSGDKVLQTNGAESNSVYVHRQSYLKLKDNNIYSNLSSNYKICVNGNKTDIYTVPMFRFAGVDQTNYYMLAFPCDRACMNSNVGAASADGAWAVYKVVDSTATKLFGSDSTSYIGRGNSFSADISIEGKKITVKVTAASAGVEDEVKSYTVDEWMQADPTKTYIGFGVNRPYGSGSQTIIRSFSVENILDLGLKDNEAYVDVATELDGENKMDLGTPVVIKKFVNNSSSPVDVSVSEDGEAYILFDTIPANGELVNDRTGKKYRYLKYSAAVDASVYVALTEEITLKKKIEGLSIDQVRLSGETVTDPVITVSGAGYVQDGKIYGSALGVLTILANGVEVGKVTVVQPVDKVVDCLNYPDVALTSLTHEDDEEGKHYTPIVLNSDWTYKMTDSDSVSQTPINNWAGASVSSAGVTLNGHGFSQTANSALPAAFYTGSLAGLKRDFILRFKLDESSALCGQSIRFMVHNDGKNFYQIDLLGTVRQEDRTWKFVKVLNGSVVAEVYGPNQGFDGGTYGSNGTFSGATTTTITVSQDGMISWIINGKRQGISESAHDFTGSYCDSNMFPVNQEDAGICVLATNDGRQTYIKELKILSAESIISIAVDGDTLTVEDFDDVAALGDGVPYGFTFVEFSPDGTVINIEKINKTAGDSTPLEYTMIDPANKVKSFIINDWVTLLPMFKSFVLN